MFTVVENKNEQKLVQIVEEKGKFSTRLTVSLLEQYFGKP